MSSCNVNIIGYSDVNHVDMAILGLLYEQLK